MCTRLTGPYLHIMYINQSGNIQHWNSTFHVPGTSDYVQIPGASPLKSAGIAMTEVSVGNGSELRAYYTTKDHIQEIVFDRRKSNWVKGQSLASTALRFPSPLTLGGERILADIDPSKPSNLAAFSHGPSPKGTSQFVEVVSTRPNARDYIAGLDTYLLTPIGDDQSFAHSKPGKLDQVANFSSVTMDMEGKLYAVTLDVEANATTVNLGEFTVDSSGTGWRMTGMVPLS